MPPHLSTYTPPAEMVKEYLSEHRVQQMFSSLLSALMMHRPEDPIQFIQTTLDEIKHIGADNVNWETFVYDLHPYRDPTRLNLIHDNSVFHQEAQRKEEEKKEMDQYKPDVFKLTESSATPSPKGSRH